MALLRFVVTIGVVYLIYLLALFFLQRLLLFPGQFRSATSHEPAFVELHWIDTQAGPVESWYLPATDAEGARLPAPGPAILFTHGNGELIEDWAIIGDSPLLVDLVAPDA